MKERLNRTRQKAAEYGLTKSNLAVVWIAAVMLLSLVATPVVAQSFTQTFSDDFEDQSVEGWESPQGEQPEISSTAYAGNYSLLAQTTQLSDQPQPAIIWQQGPVLDMTEDFTVEMIVQPDHDGSQFAIRIGITGAAFDQQGENAFIIFDKPSGQTYLATYDAGSPPSGADTIGTSYDEQWVRVTMSSEADNSTLTATVEPLTGTGPTETITQDGFEGVSGEFGINPGDDDTEPRSVYLDTVTITGQQATSQRLSLDAENYMKHGTSQEYRVLWEENTTGIANETTDVTENATVESMNTSVITVDEANNELVATNDTDVNNRVAIRAEYNGSVTYQNVTVATADVENLEVLPPLWRFSASIGSPTIQAILVAVFFGVFAGRIAGGFAGLAMVQMVMVAGWFAGYVSVGMAMVSLFTALFIGLNMAANIDYTVSR